jgi:hypothetical protein
MSLNPPKYVETVRQLIFWQYAQLIAKAAGFKDQWGFVVSRYKKLASGEMKWSSSVRDHQKELDKGVACVYCGTGENISMDHIIPRSRAGVDPRVVKLLESLDNCVCACKSCNASKSDRDVFEWYGVDRLDEVPELVQSKFLKLAYEMHETQGTLDVRDPNMDGVLNIYDLGVVMTNLLMKLGGQPKERQHRKEEGK